MLDKTKSYAEVYSHPWAKYEQGGTLYDAQGKSYDEQSDREEIQKEEGYVDPKQNTENAREWLQRQLKGGPVARDDLVRTAENEDIRWENVKNAAAEINVQANKVRDRIIWRLRLE